ncbi:MAG: diguanylate cyclase [Deltaproteobacteria bacterium]|nr:MAG: diguanylate cyclase [Deltaproteobacteria bacterium]
MNPPEPSTLPPVGEKRGLPLRFKLFLPFAVMLVAFGTATLFGSLFLLKDLTQRSLDQRLSAASEVLFREFRQQEEILLAYASFLEQFHFLSERFEQSEEIGILQDSLFTTLEKENISVTFLNISDNAPSPFPALGDFFEQARRSGKPRFRYSDQLNGMPTLLVATPLRATNEHNRILLLQASMGDDFLGKATKPLGLSAALHDLSGRMLAASDGEHTPMALRPDQISELGTAGKLFTEHDSPEGPVRHLFALIPLGTSDMIMLSVESSATEFANLQHTMIIRIALTIGAALLLGAVVYFRAVNIIIGPARELTNAARALSRGNLSYRIENTSGDELGEVAETFNQMAAQLETIYREKAEKETALIIAQQEARTKSVIERKNREVEKVNEELRSHLREISALYQLNQAMVSAPDLNVLFDRLLQVVVETMGCDQIVLLQHPQGESALIVIKSLGLNHEALRDVKFSFEQGITGLAAHSLRQIYVKDVEKDPRYLNYHGQVATRGSLVSSPMVVKGRLVGVLNLHKRAIDAFTAAELKLIQAFANQAAMAIDNAQLLEKARDLSNIDDLTGLANRRHFQEILKREVAQARRFSSNFSILMCDIDHFDHYNSKHGRLRGDATLRQVGQILLNNTRGIDLVCRFGSEEFVVLLPKTNKTGAMATAEKLRKCVLAEKFEGEELMPGGKLTVSFGVTEFPLDSKNIYELLNLADKALHVAKQAGRNRSVAWEGLAPPLD